MKDKDPGYYTFALNSSVHVQLVAFDLYDYGGRVSRPRAMEPPECPVCLQSYDGACTIPRVLTCGHTACESCLLTLPQKFPLTIRCPACTVLVKYPPQGPTFLPKNIDLLRLIDPTSPKPLKNRKNSQTVQEFDFIPRTWSNEFYTFWKQHVLPNDAVLLEAKAEEDCGFCFGCLRENQSQRVSLVKLGSLSGDDDSVFKYSYLIRVMNCLSGMRVELRDELDLILRTASRQTKFCRVLGLWGDMEDGFLCLVCERLNEIERLRFLRNRDGLCNDGFSSFALIGMEICEALISLNKQGFTAGCLGFSCFSFDHFGNLYIDLNDVLVMGRRLTKSAAEVGCVGGRICDKEVRLFLNDFLESNVFFSPEVLYELFKKEGILVECGESRYSVGYGSDVWPVACILLSLLIGEQFTKELVDYIRCVSTKASDDNIGCLGTYMAWMKKVTYLMENKFGSEFVSLQLMFCQCLNFDPACRPLLTNVWKCIRELIIKPEFDKMIQFDGLVNSDNESHCLVIGQLSCLPKERLETEDKDELLGAENIDGADVDRAREAGVVKDLVDGLSKGNVKFKDLQGHRDCVTGLATGGMDFKQ